MNIGAAMLKLYRKGTYQSPSQSSQKTAVDNPLLKVPPACRGNQDPSVPLAKRGEPKGGGQFIQSERTVGVIPIVEPEFTNSCACRIPPLPALSLKGVGFSRAVGRAGETPAFPASRVLGTRASRSHGGKDALPGNAASKHAHEKPIPLRGQGVGGILHAQEFVNFGSVVGRTTSDPLDNPPRSG